MAWRLASHLARFRNTDETPARQPETPLLPAGVVALGRGGAGAVGALRRTDGIYVGLICLHLPSGMPFPPIEEFAAALPDQHCQVLTVRWPLDPDRINGNWQAQPTPRNTTAALADTQLAVQLPAVIEAGWSEVLTLLSIEGLDPETLLDDLHAMCTCLPVPARPATLAEAKRLAGDWFQSANNGLVTIGWSLTELSAEPPQEWAEQLLGLPALAGLPTFLTLHLEPLGPAAPISLTLHRRLSQLNTEIEGRRRAGRFNNGVAADGAADLLAEQREILAQLAQTDDADERSRPAHLFIACAVEPAQARQLRSTVEACLDDLGLITASFGPGCSNDTLLACAPLGMPTLGRGLLLTSFGAGLLAPLTPAAPQPLGSTSRQVLPLGLRRDGAALTLEPGDHLLIVGNEPAAQSGLLHAAVLGPLAADNRVTVLDTTGAWQRLAATLAGERLPVALELGSLWSTLGAAQLHLPGQDSVQTVNRWVETTLNLLADLCPDLSDDECGDLTAVLLALADAAVAWGEPPQLGSIVARLRDSSSAHARHLAALLTASGALRPPATAVPDCAGFTVFDATPEQAGQQLLSAAGCAVIALQAIIEHLLRQPASQHPQLLILDNLATIVESAAGPTLLTTLCALARQRNLTIWAATASLSATPLAVRDCLRTGTVLLFPGPPEACRATLQALRLPGDMQSEVAALGTGEILAIAANTVVPLQPMLLPLASTTAPYTPSTVGARHPA